MCCEKIGNLTKLFIDLHINVGLSYRQNYDCF